MEKYKIDNIIKIIILLLILFIIYRLYVKSIIHNQNNKLNQINVNNKTNGNKKNIIENFTTIGNDYYGNVITLKNTNNKPIYSANQCIFEFDNTYRIDSLMIKFNPVESTNKDVAKFNTNKTVYIQYMDGGGNMRYLKSLSNMETPPRLDTNITGAGTSTNPHILKLNNITDENNLIVYTSKIILIIGTDINYKLANYTSSNNYGFIKEYGIYGGTRNLIDESEYNNIANTLDTFDKISTLTTKDNVNNITNFEFDKIYNDGDNIKIYALKLFITKEEMSPPTSTQQTPVTTRRPNPITDTDKPFNIIIKYNNSLYPTNEFKITTSYKVRSDNNKLIHNMTNDYEFIFLDEPIIANKLMFNVQNISNYDLRISKISINGIEPTPLEIQDYQKTINIKVNANNQIDTNICPNIDTLIETQTKTQQICDNIEFQDKVKAEKIRLERNKQYLLKLKNQQEQIDELNNIIQDLENKRQSRATTADQSRVLQYQQQKSDASQIRDLANQRLESQDAHKLFMNLNLNYTN